MEDFLLDLEKAWAAGALADREPELPRRFGDVYFAPLGDFAGGDEHFGLVRARKKGMGGTFRFSPITSTRQTGRCRRESLPMPKGTPLSRERGGVRLSMDSWLLLGLGPIPVRREKLKKHVAAYRARHVGLLPEEWISKVRAKLEGRPA